MIDRTIIDHVIARVILSKRYFVLYKRFQNVVRWIGSTVTAPDIAIGFACPKRTYGQAYRYYMQNPITMHTRPGHCMYL